MEIARLADMGVNNYGDPLVEARQCRHDSALFDFSFMSRARITGPDALQCLNSIQLRDLSTMRSGDIRYCLCTDADGVVGADLTVWKIADDCFEIFSGRSQEIDLLAAQLQGQSSIQDLSDTTSVFSLQGPKALALLCRLVDGDALRALAYFQHDKFFIGGIPCQIGRLGYTGEKGFEIVIDDPAMADILWEILAGISQPAGVAAIDILRIEAGFILFLNECRMGCNAMELGLSRFSGIDQRCCRYELVCFRANQQAVDMPWSPPLKLPKPGEGEIIVSSASLSVLCDGVLGLGFVRHPYKQGNIFTDPSKLFHNVTIADRPFYDPYKKIPRSK